MKYNCKLKILTSNLKSFSFIEQFFNKNCPEFKTIFLPTKQKNFVLLKSPHVNKKSKEHFKLLRHTRLYYVSFSSVLLLKTLLLIAPNDLNIKFTFV